MTHAPRYQLSGFPHFRSYQVAQLPELGQILAGFVESRSSAADDAAAACRLLADLAPVPEFCEGFAEELQDLVGRIASRLAKDGSAREENGGGESRLRSVSTELECVFGRTRRLFTSAAFAT